MNDQFSMILETLKRYNAGELDLSDKQANQLAGIAFQMKQEFKTRSKPIRKGLFDLIDTAALGMVPNKWRPESPGQDLFGESGIDKFAGGLGTAAGIAVPVAGVYGAYKKGATGLASSLGRASKKMRRGPKSPTDYNIPTYLRNDPTWQAKNAARRHITPKMASTGDKIRSVGASIKESEAVRRSVENARRYYDTGVNRGGEFLSKGGEYLAPRIGPAIETGKKGVSKAYQKIWDKFHVPVDKFGNPI